MPEETSCRRRNHLSTWEGTRRWTIQVATIMTMLPSANPISGESTMKTAILRMPSATNPSTPSAGSVAPMRPPASACDEEEGRPHHQVRRFQRMAPTSAAKMTVSTIAVPCDLSISNWITPLPMVLATFTPPPNAAMKLKKAAQATARFGDSTRVDTTVAIELAASWKPLMKSKMSATATMTMTAVSSISGVLQDHALDDVGDAE